MKLNNKGFAISSIMYIILVLAIIIITVTLSVLSSRELIVNKLKDEAITDILAERYLVTYQNIDDISGLPITAVGGNALEIDLTEKNVDSFKVYMNEEEVTNYIYENNILTILNVTGNVVVVGAPKLTQYIASLFSQTKTATVNGVNYSLDETNGLMYDRLGGTTTSLIDGNLRYYGVNPNNYIDIGDRESTNKIIFWRIIGVFKNVTVINDDGTQTTQDLVKIVRAYNLTPTDVDGNYVGAFSWDFKGDGTYNNNWSQSTLMTMLNSDSGYYGSGLSYTYYNETTTPITLDLSISGLSSNLKNKVAKVKWNVGKQNAYSIYVNEMYTSETAENWEGKISLMNLSDYGYAVDLSSCNQNLRNYDTEDCKDKNWMMNKSFFWALNSSSSDSSIVYYVYDTGRVGSSGGAKKALSIRPVLYLNADMIIKDIKTTNINGVETSYYVVE